jgi:hypothetical protein
LKISIPQRMRLEKSRNPIQSPKTYTTMAQWSRSSLVQGKDCKHHKEAKEAKERTPMASRSGNAQPHAKASKHLYRVDEAREDTPPGNRFIKWLVDHIIEKYFRPGSHHNRGINWTTTRGEFLYRWEKEKTLNRRSKDLPDIPELQKRFHDYVLKHGEMINGVVYWRDVKLGNVNDDKWVKGSSGSQVKGRKK